MKVSVAIYNGEGASASIETVGEWEESLTIAEGMSYTANKACREAAKRLRKAADKFDKLAMEKNPFNENTHRKINR